MLVLLAAIKKEAILIWLFIKSDLWTVIMPGLLSALTALLYYEMPLSVWPVFILQSVVYTLLFILNVCLFNQVGSIEEDRLNKPYRPLAAGLITVKQAWVRIGIYSALFIITGTVLGVLWFAVGFHLLAAIICIWGNRHWVFKNIVGISLAFIILMASEWMIIHRIEKTVWLYIVIINLWLAFGTLLQDMRDQVGDKAMGRKTLPLDIGDRNARIVLGIYFGAVAPVIYLYAISTQFENGSKTDIIFRIVFICELLWHWLIAARLWLYKTPPGDNQTYHYFLYFYCASIPLIYLLRNV